MSLLTNYSRDKMRKHNMEQQNDSGRKTRKDNTGEQHNESGIRTRKRQHEKATERLSEQYRMENKSTNINKESRKEGKT